MESNPSMKIGCARRNFEHLTEAEATAFVYETLLPACEKEGVLLMNEGNANGEMHEKVLATEDEYRKRMVAKSLFNIKELQDAVLFVRATFCETLDCKTNASQVLYRVSGAFGRDVGNGMAAAALSLAGFNVTFMDPIINKKSKLMVFTNVKETRNFPMSFAMYEQSGKLNFHLLTSDHIERLIYVPLLTDMERVGIYLTADGNCNNSHIMMNERIRSLRNYYTKKHNRTLFNIGFIRAACILYSRTFTPAVRSPCTVQQRMDYFEEKHNMQLTVGEGVLVFILCGARVQFQVKNVGIVADPYVNVKKMPKPAKKRKLK